jgi:hypothetical protein
MCNQLLHIWIYMQLLVAHRVTGSTTTGGKAMTARNDQMTSFTYTTYIHAAPELVWQGLTDPAVTKRYWRHHRAGAKTFRSDWKKGSTYDLAHEEVGLVVSDPRAGDPRVQSLSPAGLHLAYVHARVGRRGGHG